MSNDRKELFNGLKQDKYDKLRKIKKINVPKKEVEIEDDFAEKLNELVRENEKLRNELERAKAFQDAQDKIKLEEEERLRRETQGNVGVTFDGDLYSEFISYTLVSQLKYLPDVGSSEDLKETLKRFEQHILDFSYSRGDVQILIDSIQRIEVERAATKASKSNASKSRSKYKD